MKKCGLVALLGCVLFSAPVFSADLDLQNADYDESNDPIYENNNVFGGQRVAPRWTIRKRGTRVVFIDKKRKINYELDLNGNGEQELPTKYIKYLQTTPKTGGAGELIQKITISDIVQPQKNEVIAKINTYMNYDTMFGQASLKLQLGARAKSEVCPKYKYDRNNQQTKIQITCVEVETGLGARVLEFRSSLGDSADRMIGMILDLAFRFTSPSLYSRNKLYQVQ
ncbi:MAG: hypothetical protein AB7G93_01090 [Bdellovibrionales bacterium]